MGFLSPWFLGGLVALGLPIWLHLLRQYKRTPQPFSSLMFFERRVQSSVKHRRLQYLILLALRLALLALLALAFANPFVNRISASTGRKRLTVLAIDSSFSMRENNRMQQAKAQARSLLNALSGRELVQVIAFNSQVENMTQPEIDRSALTAAIESIHLSDRASSYGELTRALRVMDQSTGLQLDVHLISDMQATSMPPFRDLQLGPHTVLTLHSIIRANVPNWAIENVSTASHVYDPARTRLTATVRGWQTSAASRKVLFILDKKIIASKDLPIPANGRAQVEFRSFDVPYGMHRGQLRIEPPDTLPDDDVFSFSIERSDPRKVLFLYAAGRTREPYYYRAAMESATDTGLVVQAEALERAANTDFSKFAFVVLNDTGDPGNALARALCSYVSKGGAALIAVGPNTANAGRVPLSSDRIADVVQTQGAGVIDTQHAALLEAGQFENVQFFHTSKITPKPNARVIARFADNSPLLVEEPMGEGRVLIFASTLDNSANDFPLHASFLPFVVQTGHYLAGTDQAILDVIAGTPISLRRTRDLTTAADVIGPDGQHKLSLGDATKAMSFELADDGFYEVQRADGHRLLYAVNADRRESDLTRLPDETLALWSHTGTGTNGAESGVTERQTRPWSLWRYAVVLVLVAALAESIFGAKYIKEERPAA